MTPPGKLLLIIKLIDLEVNSYKSGNILPPSDKGWRKEMINISRLVYCLILLYINYLMHNPGTSFFT